MTATLKKQFIKLYEKNFNVARTCEQLGIKRSRVYDEMKKDEKFKTEFEEVREKMLDIAENALMTAVTQGNVTAIIFFLKTQGKHRGYVENDFNIQSANIKVEFVKGVGDEVSGSL